MSDYSELKQLAEASRVANHDERGPDEAFQDALHPEVVLELIAENERLSGCIVQRRAQAEQYDQALIKMAAEGDELRAEVAGLRTGYQAYERVNAELKAENDALRTALGPLLTHWDDVKPGESINVDRARSAMRWGECP